jgi:hypothetical protein
MATTKVCQLNGRDIVLAGWLIGYSPLVIVLLITIKNVVLQKLSLIVCVREKHINIAAHFHGLVVQCPPVPDGTFGRG